jgi:preprotein translocase subunit YajC
MWFEGIAWGAQGAGNSQTGQQVLITTVIPLALLFAVFYFLIIRPQTKKAAEHTRMLASLRRNDEVVTTGGLVGRITEIGDKVVTLEIAPNVRVRVERPQIASMSAHGKSASGKKDKGE